MVCDGVGMSAVLQAMMLFSVEFQNSQSGQLMPTSETAKDKQVNQAAPSCRGANGRDPMLRSAILRLKGVGVFSHS